MLGGDPEQLRRFFKLVAHKAAERI